MNNDLKDIFYTIQRTVRLSRQERLNMRNYVQAVVDENPARAPWRIRILDALQTISDSLGNSTQRRFHPVISVCVLVLAIGIGTSYAAEGALPGDPLYGIKIHLNESVQGAFAVSDQAHASWDASLVDKRLVEAETLAVQGRLTPMADAAIQTQLDSVTKNFDTDVTALGQSDSGAPAVAIAQSDMEASLAAHESVISTLGQSIPASKPLLAPILEKVRSGVTTASNARMRAEGIILLSDASRVQNPVSSRPASALRAETSNIELSAATTATPSGVLDATSSNIEVSTTTDSHPSVAADQGQTFNVLLGVERQKKEAQIKLDAIKNLKDQLHTSSPDAALSIEILDAEAASTSAQEGD